MSYISIHIEGEPVECLTLPGTLCIFRESRMDEFSTLHLKYGYIHPDTTFHVYMYDWFHRKRIIEKVFLCDQWDVETHIWTGQVDINLNDFVEYLSISYFMNLKFNFNSPHFNRMPSLQDLSTCAIGNTLQNNQDIQRLPLPPLLKTHFEKNYLKGLEFQNSLKSWFFCKTEEKKTLFYFGLPGSNKVKDIYEFILGKSICHWQHLGSIKPSAEYIILRINIVDCYIILDNIDYIVDIMKKQKFRDAKQKYLHLDDKIKGQLIIVSDYAPELFFDECEEKEWILDNLFVVRKN